MDRSTLSQDRFQFTLAAPVLELIDQEATLLSMDRSSFVRALVARAMGRLPLERPASAPRRDRIPMPKRRRPAKRAVGRAVARMSTSKVVFGFPPEQNAWIRRTAWELGGMAYSALLSYLVLDWAGINPLTATPDAEDDAA